MALTSGRALNTLLSDILDLAKVEAGLLNLSDDIFDLRQAATEAAVLFESVASEKGLRFQFSFEGGPTAVVGDAPARAPGDRQPDQQRGQVHQRGRGGRGRPHTAGERQRARPQGHRARHRPGFRRGHQGPAVRPLRARRRLYHLPVRRRQPRPFHRRPAGRPDGRPNRLRLGPRTRLGVHLQRAAQAGRGAHPRPKAPTTGWRRCRRGCACCWPRTIPPIRRWWR